MIKRKFTLILAFIIFIGSVKFTNLVHASENIDTGKMQVLKLIPWMMILKLQEDFFWTVL